MIGIIGIIILVSNSRNYVLKYEKKNLIGTLYEAELPVDSLCVATNPITLDGFETEDEFHAISIMNLSENNILHADNLHERLYPASTTKLMTVYLALKYGDLDAEIVVSENAQDIPIDSSRAGLRIGDRITLFDLLHGLMLPSGNDAAIVVAEYISGSVDEFVKLMNEEAKLLGATNTNFVNPHGYQDENHYTTAYDLYLIFSACMEQAEFLNIISSPSYELEITQRNDSYRVEKWLQSNWYVNGYRAEPDGVDVIGGKTGTTDEAGSCLITLLKDEKDVSYLALIMGAESRTILYDNMDNLIQNALQ